MRKYSLLVIVGAFVGAISPVFAQDATPPDINVYAGASQTVFALIAFALVIESGLAIIFNWRPFVETFNARAVRPLVALAVALVLVFTFNLDLVTALINAVSAKSLTANPTGLLLTALVIAGGSAGMNSLLVGLGFREVKTPETTPKPPPTKAWISVRALGNGSTSDIAVYIGKDDNGTIPRVGTISGPSPSKLLRFFVLDRGRFPHYGGYELDPADGLYSVALKAPDGSSSSWGPEKLGPGAIVDISISLHNSEG